MLRSAYWPDAIDDRSAAVDEPTRAHQSGQHSADAG